MAKVLLSRREFIIGGIGAGIGAVSYLYFDTHSIAVRKYTISIPNLPNDFDGFTILHLTDLHSKEYGNRQQQLLNLINRQNYDIVAITGDLVDKGNPDAGPAMTMVRNLKSKPIFFVPGNHEWWSGYQIKTQLEAEGVRILENTAFKLDKGSTHIWILGVDDPYLGRDKLNEAISVAKDKSINVLLAHAPNIFPPATKSKIDLVLVGHTHGGQVRIPFTGAIVAPGQGLFPEFDYGHFTSGSTNMIVNGGLEKVCCQ